jgi:O-methyltransferase
MVNFFITQYFDWAQPRASRRVEIVNSILKRLGVWVRLSPPVRTGTMTNVEQRINLYHLAAQVLAYRVPGEFVELGCNEGQTSILLSRIIEHYDPRRRLHVYDSFEGLPKADSVDGTAYKEGDMATKREVLLNNFVRYGLRLPIIHEGWFERTLPTEMPDKVAFAYLDGDFYSSIKTSLEYVYPNLSRDGICVIDDYCDSAIYPGCNLLPGVKKACDEYLADKPERVSYIFSGIKSHGFFRKL